MVSVAGPVPDGDRGTTPLISLPRIPPRGYIAFVHDIIMAALSFVASLYLRLGADMTQLVPANTLLTAGALFTAIAALTFWLMGLYRGVWRYASMNDLVAILRAVTVVVLVFLLVLFLWARAADVPRSLFVINWFVLIAFLGGPRFLYRLFKDKRLQLSFQSEDRPRIPVLLVGAGDGAELFIRSLARPDHANYRVVGILSETRGRVGRHIHGIQVTDVVGNMAEVVERLERRGDRPQRVILTKDSLDGALVRALLDQADALGMTLARLPRLTDFRSGVSERLELRPVDVEDLLGRPQAALDRDAMRRLIAGRRVLVTGAGGSIGSELVRQVSDLEPARLMLVDNAEFNLYSIDMECAERHPDLPREARIADVRDRGRVHRLFAEFKPEIVFHAAALKHVPLVEANPLEGVRTNVVGTVNVADACVAEEVATMVLISTDKAVNPTNVMGATKRIAESYCQALDLRRVQDGVKGGAKGGATHFVTVRFGNVLGSTGSVVPLFQKQLAAGGPLTVTDPQMKRYFMTTREAVELVILAATDSGGDRDRAGTINVLDMGEPVRILDLARQMIRLAGLKPDEDVKIEIIGPRPGEKLFEEVFHGGEELVPTAHPGILLARPRATDEGALRAAIGELAGACAADDRAGVKRRIGSLVPEYHAAG
ncbi:MAG: polysaccharide biosynthesis protein [Hyphomicrobiales bacterium]|nr:polysaccharide biosynthesis protein [Hyphomicrobiales bacterium]MCP5370508.1 polysaccharide biosynthesis protein [Hyphomicrobiales bacterium]